MMDTLPLPKLLARIHLDKLPHPDCEGLFELVRAFRCAIPFENLDTLAGAPVGTGLDSIVDKIVINGRGGWCYELNQLFGEVLKAAGFSVKYRMARVGYKRPSLGPLTHLLLLVELGSSQWLVDVGFGGAGPTEPLRVAEGECVGSRGERFRVSRGKAGDITLHRWIGDAWECLYRVESLDIMAIDIDMACHFTSTWPHSPFHRMFMCVAYDGQASWTIEENDLVQRDSCWMQVARAPIEGPRHLHSVFETYFRIQVSEALVQKAWEQVVKSRQFSG